MQIEQAIHQPHFRNEYQKAMVNLMYTHGWLIRQLKAHLKPFGVSLPQYNVLRILNGSFPEPISTSVIANRMLDKASDASRIVDRLYKKGWVEKRPCATDKRLVDVLISTDGIALMEELDQNNQELDELMAPLSDSEAQQLNELLDKVRG